MGCCGGAGCACGSGKNIGITVNQSICPLCGGPNNCATEIAKATGEPEQPCWCRNETFTAELLATIPAEAQGVTCVCQNCVQAATSS